jgi:DNA-binding response OmpR family regulator
MGRLLIVDDDPDVRAMLVRFFEGEGYETEEAPGGAGALTALRDRSCDLVLLDVMLTAESGLDLLTVLRRTSDVPVILLTARAGELDRVLGLKLGADDYVVKPFSPAELAARIETVLRRTHRPGPGRHPALAVAGARSPKDGPPASDADSGRLEFGDLVVDRSTRDVWVAGTAVTMTAKEFDLLAFLAGSPRQVFSRQQLLAQVWESSSEWQDAGTVTEHVRRVRRKIEGRPDTPRWIRTVHGVGYRFEP